MAINNNKNKARVVLGTRMMSTIAIGLTLFTLGVVGLLQIAKVTLTKTAEEQVVYRLPLPSSFSSSDIDNAISKIRKQPYTLSVSIITTDSMAKSVSEKLGDNPVDVLGYNPFSPIISLNIKSEYSNADSINKVQNSLNDIIPNTVLNYRRDQLDYIRGGIGKISIILEFFILLQLIVTFVQIGNTTKLIIHSKRMQIRTLSLVGASKSFISRPIVRRAVIDGLIGSVISIILLSLLIWGIDSSMGISLYDTVLPYKFLLIMYSVLVLISVIISYLSALLTANRYIRMDGGKINLI